MTKVYFSFIIVLSEVDTYRTRFKPQNNVINNNLIENFDIDFNLEPAIKLYGIGNKVSHNQISNGNSIAIRLFGNNNIIEYNLPNSNSSNPDLWLVKSISTDVSVNGTQNITAIRYYPLYADIAISSARTSYDIPSQ